jgi:hypothetical protein
MNASFGSLDSWLHAHFTVVLASDRLLGVRGQLGVQVDDYKLSGFNWKDSRKELQNEVL